MALNEKKTIPGEPKSMGLRGFETNGDGLLVSGESARVVMACKEGSAAAGVDIGRLGVSCMDPKSDSEEKESETTGAPEGVPSVENSLAGDGWINWALPSTCVLIRLEDICWRGLVRIDLRGDLSTEFGVPVSTDAFNGAGRGFLGVLWPSCVLCFPALASR